MSDSPAQTMTADTGVVRDVQRALGELRCGRIVRLLDSRGGDLLVQAAEGIQEEGLAALAAASCSLPHLLLTARRAQALGLHAGGNAVVAFDLRGLPAQLIAELADPTSARACPIDALSRRVVPPPTAAAAAIDLTKLARLLPAAVAAPAGGPSPDLALLDLMPVEREAVERYQLAAAHALTKAAESAVPLLGAEEARIVAFRPPDGGQSHLAIVIGQPDPEEAVLTRLHSECFTGDLLASLRCDCGDQLRGAIQAIGAAGAGVLLYLAQEGRGIGLVNKLRAYTLQDRGADTLEANQQLGFDADERVYLPAAEMLRQLGFRRVRLLTNNPEKVRALGRCGISVEERVPHHFPSNGHNEAYLSAKARHFGHLF